jgi:hypothetical protein
MVSVDHQAESNGSSYSHLSVRQGILILAQMLSNLEQRMMTNASLTQSFIYTVN